MSTRLICGGGMWNAFINFACIFTACCITHTPHWTHLNYISYWLNRPTNMPKPLKIIYWCASASVCVCVYVCAWLIRCHTRRIRNTWETERVRGGARGGSRECDNSPSRRRCQCACCSHNSPKIFCVSMACEATKQESTRKYPSIICKKRQTERRKRKRARERRRSERDSDAKWMKMLSIELFYNNSTYFLYINN